MLDESIIKSKFSEFQEKYSGRNIDDFENYILSRTIEYFYNTDRRPIDELVSLIARYLKGEEPCAPDEQVSRGETVESKTDGAAADSVQDTHSKEPETACRRKWVKRALAAAAICVLVLGGGRACWSWAKKGRRFFVLRKRRR